MKKEIIRQTGRHVRVLLGLTAAVVLSACGDVSGAGERIDRAQAHRADGEPRSAVIELRNVLQDDPENAEARELLGLTYLDVEDMASAAKELGRARELGRSSPELTVALGTALLADNRFDRLLREINVDETDPAAHRARVEALRARAYIGRGASEHARQALEQADSLAAPTLDSRLGRTELALAQGRIAQARDWAERATEANPESAQAWRQQARSALAASDYEAAIAATTKAIESAGNPTEDYLQRAHLRVIGGDTEAARSDLAQIGGRAAEHPRVRFVDSLIAWADEDFDTACSQLGEVVSAAPEFVEARYYLGACHYRNGELNQAEAHLRWVDQRVGRPDSGRLLAAVQLAMGEPERARATLRPIVAQYPDDAEAHALLGRSEMALGNTAEGIAHLERLVALRPGDAEARLQLGSGLLATGLDSGETVFSEALALDPEMDQAAEMLIVSLVRSGEYDRAAAEAERLAEKRSAEALPLNLLALVEFSRNDLAAARAALERAIVREPADPGARHNLARLVMAEQDWSQAREHYEAVTAERPAHTATLLAQAELETIAGNPESARRLLERARDSDPAAEAPRRALANHHMDNGDPAAAVAAIGDTATGAEAEAATVELAARAHLRTGDAEQAADLLEGLVAREPTASEGHLLLAQAYTALGQPERAISQLDRLLEVAPNDPRGLMLLAQVRLREGDEAASSRLLDRLDPADNEHPLALELRARLAGQGGDAAAAAEGFGKAYEADPTEDRLLRWSAALRRAGQTEQARSVLTEAIANGRGSAAVHLALGDLYTQGGDGAQAQEAYREALASDPDSVRALNNLAWYQRRSDPPEAIRLARRALDNAPDNPAVQDTLGVALFHDGQFADAVAMLRQAHEAAPDAPDLRFHLARALAAAEQPEEARTRLQELLAADTEFDGRGEAEALLTDLGG